MPSVMHGRILIWAKSQWRFTKTATVRAILPASYAVMLLARGVGLICHASCACGLPPAKIVFLRWLKTKDFNNKDTYMTNKRPVMTKFRKLPIVVEATQWFKKGGDLDGELGA